jgi:hypothetical protein
VRLLLTAVDHALFEPAVPLTVLEEVELNVLEAFPQLDPTAFRRRVGHMRNAHGDHLIALGNLQAVPAVINPKDRHVVAAAIDAEATMVVTSDRRLRDQIAASKLGIEPLTGDAFAMRLWTEAPAEVGVVIESLIAKRQRRPVTGDEMADQLAPHFPSWLPGGHPAEGRNC